MTKIQTAFNALRETNENVGQAKALVAKTGVRISARTWAKAISARNAVQPVPVLPIKQSAPAPAPAPVHVNDIINYEAGEQSHDDTIKMFQNAINSGLAWRLQGSYGREAMSLIESGDCILGEVGHRDYYGNYVPSRFEVQAGTKGSVEYQQRMLANR